MKMEPELLYNEEGFPNMGLIRSLWKKYGIDKTKVTFNADYGKRKAGFLWKAHSIDDDVRVFLSVCHIYGVEIKSTKLHGRIHSVWFVKKS